MSTVTIELILIKLRELTSQFRLSWANVGEQRWECVVGNFTYVIVEVFNPAQAYTLFIKDRISGRTIFDEVCTLCFSPGGGGFPECKALLRAIEHCHGGTLFKDASLEERALNELKELESTSCIIKKY